MTKVRFLTKHMTKHDRNRMFGRNAPKHAFGELLKIEKWDPYWQSRCEIKVVGFPDITIFLQRGRLAIISEDKFSVGLVMQS